MTTLRQGRGRDSRGLRRIRTSKLRITVKKAGINHGEREAHGKFVFLNVPFQKSILTVGS